MREESFSDTLGAILEKVQSHRSKDPLIWKLFSESRGVGGECAIMPTNEFTASLSSLASLASVDEKNAPRLRPYVFPEVVGWQRARRQELAFDVV